MGGVPEPWRLAATKAGRNNFRRLHANLTQAAAVTTWVGTTTHQPLPARIIALEQLKVGNIPGSAQRMMRGTFTFVFQNAYGVKTALPSERATFRLVSAIYELYISSVLRRARCDCCFCFLAFVFHVLFFGLLFSPCHASLTHYKLYLVSKVAAKINGDDDLEPANFRGEGAQASKKKKKRCLNFSENEFEVICRSTCYLPISCG